MRHVYDLATQPSDHVRKTELCAVLLRLRRQTARLLKRVVLVCHVTTRLLRAPEATPRARVY